MSDGSTPGQPESNAPGLSALAYRAGTYASFYADMIARLHTQSIPSGPNTGTRPLAALTTRAADDPVIALLDACAVVCDVLTFYQERIANEAFLRTAIERRSVLELARAIGYELAPGVAASTYLAFTIDNSAGAPPSTTVPAGTKVQSIPAQGGLPQTFETSTDLQAAGAWNALTPRMTRPQDLAICGGALWLLGISTSFPASTPGLVDLLQLAPPVAPMPIFAQPGAAALGATPVSAAPPPQPAPVSRRTSTVSIAPLSDATILAANLGSVPAVPARQVFFAGIGLSIKTGDRLLFVGQSSAGPQALAFIANGVVEEPALARTTVTLTAQPQTPPPFAPAATAAERSAVPALALQSGPQGPLPFTQSNLQTALFSNELPDSTLGGVIALNAWNDQLVDRAANYQAPPPAPPVDRGAFVLRAKAGVFGSSAPSWASLPLQLRYTTTYTTNPADAKSAVSVSPPYPAPGWDVPNGPSIWTDSGGNVLTNGTVRLDRVVPGLLDGGWALLEAFEPGDAARTQVAYRVRSIDERVVTDYALSLRTASLALSDLSGSIAPSGDDFAADFGVRNTTVYLQSQGLALAEVPIDDPLQPGDTSIVLDGMVLGLTNGLPIAVSGMLVDPPGVPGSEILFISQIVHSNRFTTLTFTTGLVNGYVRQSVTINANVVAATNGESVTEILGSGDASQARQSFTLKRPPLTYVSAATASGVQSTLAVRVNGILWNEQQSLYGLSNGDRAFAVRIADDGTTTVTFGDGSSGSRLPTGSQNVVAAYRTGIGSSGNTGAGTIKILQSKPLGVKSAANPVTAADAADPESLANARVNAPLRVLTLDRIVSLDDYESFALAFAGVGKAQAVVLWNGATQIIGITVADAAGNSPAPTSALLQNLAQAIDAARSPGQPVVISGFAQVLFNLSAALLIDPAYQTDTVRTAVSAAILANFSFAARAFAQSVTAAELFSTIQAVPGIIAVTLTQLYVSTAPADAPPPVLLAAGAAVDAGVVTPAALLLVNPAGLTLTEMAP
jgi:hypothetical protein